MTSTMRIRTLPACRGIHTRTLLRDDVVIRTKTWEEPIPRDHQ
jgi:hypothetical protein